MPPEDAATEALLQRAGQGDRSARDGLLALHRARLRKMVAVRMDPRLAARVDPSDIVQDALAEAARNLSDYLRRRPLPFYPWLRRLAWESLVAMTRYHIKARRRSLAREQAWDGALPDQSALALAGRLVAGGSSPSARLIREEQRERVQSALGELEPHDREVLVLRYLEELSTQETAAVLGISTGGVKSRLWRALVRLQARLEDPMQEGQL
jgi:RNA polymerase sigma-70 factor (ECF subfamily)